jgi:FkbH-like protein
MLGHLADCGVLLGVSSKNELAVARAALARKDLLFHSEALFPVLADWGAKSRAVGEILRTWNIGAESVVFVDDNRMELSEVQQAYPAMTCLQFPKNDPAKLWGFLGELRDLFGKPVLFEEDQLRRASIRAASQMHEGKVETSSLEFLRSLQGAVTLDYRKTPSDKRPLELVNKTNQFNLNGVRLSEGEWQRLLEADDRVTVTVSYQDKFGPLGKIAVLLAQQHGRCLRVSHWVMSCRAFSRRIEHHTLDNLFRHWNAEEIEFAFQPTERNQPLQEFFQSMGIQNRLTHSQFLAKSEDLPHQTSELV